MNYVTTYFVFAAFPLLVGLLIAAVFDYRASCERQRAWDDLLVRIRRGDFDGGDL